MLNPMYVFKKLGTCVYYCLVEVFLRHCVSHVTQTSLHVPASRSQR